MQDATKKGQNIISSAISLVLLVLILSFPASFLWNEVLTVLFSFPKVDYWQTVGLMSFVYLVSRVFRF